jgi:hypothetical protein
LATPNPDASGDTTRFAFQHLTKQDGTSDSICLRCHAVVATSHNEYSLEQAERTHVCPPTEPPQQGLMKQG